MKNIRVSSVETDRKIARIISIIFMILVGLFLVSFWTLVLLTQKSNWDAIEIFLFASSVPAVILIPFQLVRYWHSK